MPIFAPQYERNSECNLVTDGAIAQLVEQRTENPCVPGSIPGGTTDPDSRWSRGFLFLIPDVVQAAQHKPARQSIGPLFAHPTQSARAAGVWTSVRHGTRSRMGYMRHSAATYSAYLLKKRGYGILKLLKAHFFSKTPEKESSTASGTTTGGCDSAQPFPYGKNAKGIASGRDALRGCATDSFGPAAADNRGIVSPSSGLNACRAAAA